MADAKSHWKRNLGIGVLVILLILGGYVLFVPGALIPPEDEELTATTWTLIDYVTREDVSDFVEISVWIDDKDIDEPADIRRLSNFDEEITSDDAEDVSLDLRDVNYAWVEIEPDQEEYYSRNMHLYVGGTNFDYEIEVYHMPSTVMITNIDRATGCACLLSNCSGYAGENETVPYQGSGNYTMALDLPIWNTAEPQCGNHWDMEKCPPDMDADDVEEEDWLITYNERSHRCEAPLYISGDDDSKEFDTHLEQITNAFVIKIRMNETVNCTDGSTNQVNMTLRDELYSESIELISCGDSIFVVFYGTIKFFPKLYSFSYEIVFGTTIEWCNIESGRMEIPRGAKACPLGTFTAYQSICQCNITAV